MAQIRQVVSESLQATVRRLLPSQQGFTEDLQASNVIQPIIDLTPTAEGSALPTDMARGLSFGGITGFQVTNTTSTVINNAGFWQISGAVNTLGNAANSPQAFFRLNDGSSTKTFVRYGKDTGASLSEFFQISFEYVLFLPAGVSFEVQCTNDYITVDGEYHQIADVSGNLVNPSGFTSS